MTNIQAHEAAAAMLTNTSGLLKDVSEAFDRLATAVDTLVGRYPLILDEYITKHEGLIGALSPTARGVASTAGGLSPLDQRIAQLLADLDAAATAPGLSVSGSSAGFAATATSNSVPSTTSTADNEFLTPAQVEAHVAHLPEARTYYVVFRGLEPGIYDTSAEASEQVTGIAFASMEKFNPKSTAIAQYTDHYNRRRLRRLP